MECEHITTFEGLCACLAIPQYVIIDFVADWCGPCKAMSPVVKELAKFHPHIKFIKIDVGKTCKLLDEWVQQMNITKVPTFLIFKDNREIDRIVGSKIDELCTKVQKLG